MTDSGKTGPRSATTLVGDGREWIGGRFASPLHITGEAEPYRPTCVMWIELPEEVVVAFDLCHPADECDALGKALVEAIRHPLVGPPRQPRRIRVADEDLAIGAKRVVGELIPVTIAATPELENLAAAMFDSFKGASGGEPSEESGEERASYLQNGRVSHAAVAELFDAASLLRFAAPWTIVSDQQVLRLDIPELGVDGACVSIIGALGQSLGLLIFPSLAGYEAFQRAETQPRRKSSRIDLGTSWLSLALVSRAELPEACRREILEYGWSASEESSFPQVEHWDRDGVLKPLVERDVHIASACANSLSAFFVRNREALESRDVEPICQSLADENDRIVRFTIPYEAFSLFDVAQEVPHSSEGSQRPRSVGAQIHALPKPPSGAGRDETPLRESALTSAPTTRPKPGRNDRCPCGSGKKYKQCCLLASDATEFKRRQINRAAEEFGIAAAELITRLDVADPVRAQAQEFWEIASNAGLDLDDDPEQESIYEIMMSLFLSWLVYSFRPLVEQEKSKRRRRRETAAVLMLQQAGKRLDPLQAR